MGRRLDFLLWIFGGCVFASVLATDYVGDDIANSCVYGCILRGDWPSVFGLSNHFIAEWIRNGRFFPLSSYLCYYSHAICNMICYLYAYKVFLAALSLVNLILFQKAASLIAGSRDFGRWAGLAYVAVLPIDFRVHSAYWTYHGMMQSVMGLGFVSIISLFAALQSRSSARAIVLFAVSVLAHAMALMIYEPSFCLVVVLGWILFCCLDRPSFMSRVFLLVPYLLPVVAIGGWILWHQIGGDSSYCGTTASFALDKVCATFLCQLTSIIPGFTLAVALWKGGVDPMVIWDHLWTAAIWGVLVAFFVLAGYGCGKEVRVMRIRRNVLLVLIGAIFLLFPCVLMAVSARYQTELTLGRGWLPGYMSTFGLALLIAGVSYGYRVPMRMVGCLLIPCAMIGFVALGSSIGDSHAFVPKERSSFLRDVRAGLLDGLGPFDYIWLDQSLASRIHPHEASLGVARLCSVLSGKPIRAYPIDEKPGGSSAGGGMHFLGISSEGRWTAVPLQSIGLGEEVRFADDNRIFLLDGMSGREAWGVWSCAPDCAFMISLPEAEGDLRLTVRAQAYLRMRKAEVCCNGEKIAVWDVRNHAAVDRELRIPSRFAGNRVTIRFRLWGSARPCDVDSNSSDTREVGLGFLSLRLTHVD